MVRPNNFLVTSLLLLATCSLAISAPAGGNNAKKQCTGASCSSPTKSSNSSPPPSVGAGTSTNTIKKPGIRDYYALLREQNKPGKLILYKLYKICLDAFGQREKLLSYATMEECLNDVTKEFPDLTTGLGAYGLVYAASSNRADIVREMLKRGADPNLQVKDFSFPLYEACYHGNFEMTRLLLENGDKSANPNIYNPFNEISNHFLLTPLMAAANQFNIVYEPWSRTTNYAKCVELLIKHKANKNERNLKGETAFDIAKDLSNDEIKNLLNPKVESKGTAPKVSNLEATKQPATKLSDLPSDVWERIHDLSDVPDRANLRKGLKVLSKMTPRVWELFCFRHRMDPSHKVGLLVEVYSFCFRNYTLTWKHYPTIQKCLDNVNTDLPELMEPKSNSYSDGFDSHQIKLIYKNPNVLREIMDRKLVPNELAELLYTSAVDGNKEIVQILLEHKVNPVNPKIFVCPECIPIVGAVEAFLTAMGESERSDLCYCVELLLNHGADPKKALEIIRFDERDESVWRPMVDLLSSH